MEAVNRVSNEIKQAYRFCKVTTQPVGIKTQALFLVMKLYQTVF